MIARIILNHNMLHSTQTPLLLFLIPMPAPLPRPPSPPLPFSPFHDPRHYIYLSCSHCCPSTTCDSVRARVSRSSQSLTLLPQHVRFDWTVSDGQNDTSINNANGRKDIHDNKGVHESNEFPSDYARFVVSPVVDAAGSDYAYVMLGESVRAKKVACCCCC